MDEFYTAKWVSIFLLSTVKFMFAPASVVAAGFGFFQTILVTTLGGMTGVTAFYFFGKWIIRKMESFQPQRRKSKGVFSPGSRKIIRIKGRVGFYGLVVLTPSFLSIPIGCILAAKFYRHHNLTYPLLLVSTVVWSILLTIFSTHLKELIFT